MNVYFKLHQMCEFKHIFALLNTDFSSSYNSLNRDTPYGGL